MAAEQRLPELIVKEAIGAGLESPMRESILEAVEDAEGPRRRISIPVAAGAVAVGTAIGYGLGSADTDSIPTEEKPLPVDTPKPIADGEADSDDEPDTGGSRMAKLLILGAIAGAVVYFRRRRSSDEDGWEPIDEVEQPMEEATNVVETLTEESDETASAGDRVTDAESAGVAGTGEDDGENDERSQDGEAGSGSESDDAQDDSS